MYVTDGAVVEASVVVRSAVDERDVVELGISLVDVGKFNDEFVDELVDEIVDETVDKLVDELETSSTGSSSCVSRSSSSS